MPGFDSRAAHMETIEKESTNVRPFDPMRVAQALDSYATEIAELTAVEEFLAEQIDETRRKRLVVETRRFELAAKVAEYTGLAS
jgi:hypothetical protein